MNKWANKLGAALACVLAFCALAPLTALAAYDVHLDYKLVDGVKEEWLKGYKSTLVPGGTVPIKMDPVTGMQEPEWLLYKNYGMGQYESYETIGRGWAITLKYEAGRDQSGVTWHLIPSYVPLRYKLTYPAEVITNIDYFAEVKLTTPSKEGHTFGGWTSNTGKTITEEVVTGEDLGVTSNALEITLTENWSVNTYTVKINHGTGGSGGDSTNYTYSSSFWSWEFTPPTRLGYHIESWTIKGYKKSKPTIEDSTITIAANEYGDIRATPTWEANTANVTYRVDEGKLGAFCPSDATYDEPFKVSMPTWEGHTFTGWQVTQGLDPNTAQYSLDEGTTWLSLTSDEMLVGANCSTIYFKNLMSRQGTGTKEKDIILFANWSKIIKYAISVVASPEEGGTVTGGGGYSSKEEIYLEATASTGYTFEKWADAPSEPAKRYLVVTNDATYTAIFKGDQHDIYFKVSNREIYGSTVTYGQPYGELPEPEARVGWVFVGWFDDGKGGTGEQITSNTIVRVVSDYYTFYSRWEIAPPNYVAFDGNEATSGTMAVQMFTNGVAQALNANAYMKEGVSFAGWATNKVGEVIYADRQTITLSLPENTTNTLWAVWTNNVYTVTLKPGSHVTGDVQTLCKTNGTPLILPDETYERGGYEQKGWSYDAGGLTNDYPFGSNYVANASTTLYPYWSAKQYTITIYAGYEGGTNTYETYATQTTEQDIEFVLPKRTGYTVSSVWQISGATGGEPTIVYKSHNEPYVRIPAGAYGDISVTAQWTGDNCDILVYEDSLHLLNTVSYQVAETNQNVQFTPPPGKSILLWIFNPTEYAKKVAVSSNSIAIAANTYGNFTIYPSVWTNNVYTITLAPGEGGTGGSTKNYTYSDRAATCKDFDEKDFPTRVGYHIGDWVLTGGSDCDYEVDSGTLYIYIEKSCHGDITATPIWEADPNPPPGEADRRDISAVSFTDGKLTMTFTNADERFDYLLRGTNTLENAPRPWPLLWTTNGTGTIVIEPPKTSETKMFYYLETSQRK